jgi:hypothetical protein
MMRGLLCVLMIAAPASGATAQQGGATYVLLITGLSAEPRFARSFGAAAGSIYDAAREQWHVADSNLAYLAEDPAADPKRISGKATKAIVEQVFASLARRVRPGDVVLIFLLGHGSGEMAASAVNLPGPDPTAADYADWLAPLARATVVFVNASSASGDFAPLLAGPNRVIVTATRTAIERNESIFAVYFAKGLTGTEADADKDGRVSIVEAFDYAREQVAKAYESTARVAFGGDATSADPRVSALMGERRVLEASVDSLRRLKTTMASTAYSHELERLLLQVAAKTRAIKALQSGAKP